jgi:hypothetical protein
MTFLRSLITRSSSFDRPSTGTESKTASDSGGEHSQFDAMWDEALMASMHCETARTLLDRMGPRWK